MNTNCMVDVSTKMVYNVNVKILKNDITEEKTMRERTTNIKDGSKNLIDVRNEFEFEEDGFLTKEEDILTDKIEEFLGVYGEGILELDLESSKRVREYSEKEKDKKLNNLRIILLAITLKYPKGAAEVYKYLAINFWIIRKKKIERELKLLNEFFSRHLDFTNEEELPKFVKKPVIFESIRFYYEYEIFKNQYHKYSNDLLGETSVEAIWFLQKYF